MKYVVLLVLICSMIGFPAKAVNPTITVRVTVSSDVNRGLIRAYLQRELRNLDGVEVREVAEWEIHVVAVRLSRGLYAFAIGVVRNRYLKPYLRQTLENDLKELLGVIPEYYTTIVHTGYDLDKMCANIVVGIESDILR